MSISTFHGLNTAFRALQAQQRSLDTTSHNIANANTEGYTRQEAVLQASDPLANSSVFASVLPGQLGTGVDVQSYQRIRDQFNDAALRQNLGQQSGAEVRQDALRQVELTLPEPGDNGLQALMTKFWSSWQDVASNPENTSARTALAQGAQSLASFFNAASANLVRQRSDADSQATSVVADVNSKAQQVATLNDSIAKLVAVGQSPNDLLDQRDKLIDDLSKLGNVTVSYSGNSVATVTLGGLTVVDPSGAQARTRANFDGQFPASLTPSAGKLGALLDVYQNTVPRYQARLDSLAVALHDDVNAVHAAGFGLTGATGQSFFAGATITGASQLAVDPAVLADPRLIAAASSATSGAGDSSNAVAVLARRQAVSSTLATTFDDHYSATISDLGVAAQQAARDKDTSDAVVNTLRDRRDATSGVSLDEEMTNLIKFQHAYSAAGRVMSVMDSLLDTLIHIGA